MAIKLKKSSGNSKEIETKKSKRVVEEKSKKKSKDKPEKKKKKKVVEQVVIKPIKEKISKNDLVERLMEKCDLDKKQVKAVIAELETIIKGSLVKKSCGEFNFQGLFKLRIKDVPAQKGGVKKKNPFKPGEMMVTKSKPASVKVKALALGKLKKFVVGEE
jgi:nucleoid DNA-binding protein